MADAGIRVDIEWSCPTCTYINKAGSFKCSVCGTLKGTATRQVKYHLSTLEQQYMSETLQSNRFPSGRSLAKLQAQSHTSSSTSSLASSSLSSLAESSLPPFSSPPLPLPPTTMQEGAITPPLLTPPLPKYEGIKTGTSNGTGSVKKKQRLKMSLGNRHKFQPFSKWPRLRNIDRSRVIRSQDITVNNVTVTITEYPLLYPDSE